MRRVFSSGSVKASLGVSGRQRLAEAARIGSAERLLGEDLEAVAVAPRGRR